MEEQTPIEVSKDKEPIEAQLEQVLDPVFNNMYCSTCSMRLTDKQLMKLPIDYRVTADGASAPSPERYSLFCGKCQKFLGIYDPKAQKELEDMTKTRLEQEHAKD